MFICVKHSANRGTDKCASLRKGYGDTQKMSVFYLNLGVQTLGYLVKSFAEG